jgi:DNA adenine methylase
MDANVRQQNIPAGTARTLASQLALRFARPTTKPPRKQMPALTSIPHEALEDRAERPLSALPRPFLRWAGSKRMLLSQLVAVLPAQYGTYREPFLGGGSLFFLLEPQFAVLSDSCEDLVATYEAIRENPSAVLRYLTPLRPERDLFYQIRSNRSSARFKRAAEFIYLNKTCWNGLYRVNAQGEFNVPYGAPRTETVIDPVNLHSCAAVLSRPGVRLSSHDFEDALLDAEPGDLVFLDPPYVTRHNNNGFVDYNELIFSWHDQERVARAANRLAADGVHVLVTNAFHREVLDLYDGFHVIPIHRPSTIASSASRRGGVTEALLWRAAS